MDPERWKKIEELYNAAIEHDAGERTVFLKNACDGDDSLRSQVESLLEFEPQAENFIETPAFEVAAKAVAATLPKVKIGQTIHHYKIEKLLGSGGMGEVYLAEDLQLGRKVALKLLAPQFVSDEPSRKRFLREARLASALDHPNICGIHEIGEADGICFISMQYIEGKTLGDHIGAEPLALDSLLSIGAQIADAISTAHSQGIIHRDIKSSNILITSRGQVKVLDFGLAKSFGPDGSFSDTKITQTGVIKGTPAYMSPEQARAEEVDHRSDIFSFGVVLYEMAAGHLPFKKRSKAETMNSIINEPHAAIDDIPDELSAIIDHALQKKPNERPIDIGQLRDQLGQLLNETTRTDERSSGSFYENFKPIAVRHRRFLGARIKILLGIIAAILIIGSAFVYRDYSNRNWAQENIQNVEELAGQRKFFAAYDLALQIDHYLPDNEAIKGIMPRISGEIDVVSEPAGAKVYLKRFIPDSNGIFPERELVGQTPINKLRIARGSFVLYVENQGYSPIERTISLAPEQMGPTEYNPPPPELNFKMRSADDFPARMVFVPGSDYRLMSWRKPTSNPAQIDDYFIDKFEVSNREFKEFVTAGGYLKQEFWTQPFMKDGKTLNFEDAVAQFKDKTGMPSPRNWSNQNFPEGKGDHPVTDVSWYEAAAYAMFRGKSLPSIYQWEKAARDGFAMHGTGSAFPWGRFQKGDSLDYRANFVGKYSVAVESFEFGMSPYGAYNMAGNVTEWTRNELQDGFSATGGSWGEPYYGFGVISAFPGFYVSDKIGFRCVKNLKEGEQGGGKIDSDEIAQVAIPSTEAEFKSMLPFYRYDKTPLEPEIAEVKETDEWRREKIIFNGAGDQRVIGYLYLPKNFKRPLSLIQYVPAADVYWHFTTLPKHLENFMTPYIKSGHAVFSVVLDGFIEREHPSDYVAPKSSTIKYLDRMVNDSTDLSRGLDYLETRDDIDSKKIIYWGYSKGGELGLIFTAVEKRYIAAVFIGVGIWNYFDEPFIKEANRINFAPHIKIPKLMVNGRYDEQSSWEANGKPLFDLLSEPKSLEFFEGGHTPAPEIAVPIISKWLNATVKPPQAN